MGFKNFSTCPVKTAYFAVRLDFSWLDLTYFFFLQIYGDKSYQKWRESSESDVQHHVFLALQYMYFRHKQTHLFFKLTKQYDSFQPVLKLQDFRLLPKPN